MTRSRNQFRARVEVLEDRMTPTVLGLGSLPTAAQAGLAIAAAANAASQAPNHSPVFEAPTTGATPALANLTLPPASQPGLAIAAAANAASQAPNHSPVFEASTTGAAPALANFTLPPVSATGIDTAAGNAASQALNLSPVFQL
jgi:hypothetical protein